VDNNLSSKGFFGILGIIVLGAGLIAIFTAVEIASNMPSKELTFLGIPYAENPAWNDALFQIILRLAVGIAIAGVGVWSLEQLGKQKPSKISLATPPQVTNSSQIYYVRVKDCKFCGAQMSANSNFCSKCGKCQ
jgi:hypothetical protein